MNIQPPQFGLPAKWMALTASSFTSMLALFEQNSLAHSVHGDSLLFAVVNTIVLLLSLLGWADLFWHDIRGKLLLPRFDYQRRHQICVALYSALASMFLMRAFAAAGAGAGFLSTYYLSTAVGIGLIAVIIALETRCELKP